MWRTPALAKEFTPFALHRTYGGPFDDLTCVDWSADGFWLLTGGRDLTARVFSLDPVNGYEPPTLSGHRDRIVSCFWGDSAASSCYTVSKDGALFHWSRKVGGVSADMSADTAGEGSAARGQQLAQWTLEKKHFFFQVRAISSCLFSALLSLPVSRAYPRGYPPGYPGASACGTHAPRG